MVALVSLSHSSRRSAMTILHVAQAKGLIDRCPGVRSTAAGHDHRVQYGRSSVNCLFRSATQTSKQQPHGDAQASGMVHTVHIEVPRMGPLLFRRLGSLHEAKPVQLAASVTTIVAPLTKQPPPKREWCESKWAIEYTSRASCSRSSSRPATPTSRVPLSSQCATPSSTKQHASCTNSRVGSASHTSRSLTCRPHAMCRPYSAAPVLTARDDQVACSCSGCSSGGGAPCGSSSNSHEADAVQGIRRVDERTTRAVTRVSNEMGKALGDVGSRVALGRDQLVIAGTRHDLPDGSRLVLRPAVLSAAPTPLGPVTVPLPPFGGFPRRPHGTVHMGTSSLEAALRSASIRKL